VLFSFHALAIFKCLTLLSVANGSPVIAKRVFGKNFSRPVDGGVILADGQPVFGSSKTIRGILIAVVLTTFAGSMLGLSLSVGALAGAGAMIGDLLSSFTKRRLKLPPSSKAPGLDQVPESLLPLIVIGGSLGLSVFDILIGVGIFWGGEVALSRWLYALKIRDRPY
jgi:hypothetical protein